MATPRSTPPNTTPIRPCACSSARGNALQRRVRQQAFFFVDGRYLGTDASTPSGQIAVVNQSDTEVTLAYSLYRSSDPICCPGGGRAQVRFQLNNGRLTALDPIPATQPATGDGRR